jgi:hypothetical protein
MGATSFVKVTCGWRAAGVELCCAAVATTVAAATRMATRVFIGTSSAVLDILSRAGPDVKPSPNTRSPVFGL